MNEKLISRIKLLYERNNSSPLFLKVADFYISENEADKARLVLEQGLKLFPQNPLAFILLGKLNYIQGNIDESDSFFKRASDLLDSDRTYYYYKKKLKLPDKPDSPFNFSRGNIFINSIASEKIEPEIDDKSESIDNRLAQLAEAMMNAKIERNDNFSVPETYNESYSSDKIKLASETLANIFLSQGEKNEAINIFKILIDRNPGKKDYYLKRIFEIKSQ